MFKPFPALCAATVSMLSFLPAFAGEPALPADCPEFTATTSEPVLLRYKAKAGQKVRFDADMDTDMVMDIGSAGGMKIRQGMHTRLEAGYLVESVESNGDFEAKMTFHRIVTKISGLQDVTLDTDKPDAAGSPAMKALAAMTKVPITVKFSATGKPLKVVIKPLVESIEKAGNTKMAASLRESADETMRGAFVQLPEKPVRAGEGYDAGEIVKEFPGAGKVTTNIRYEVLRVSADKKQALLRVKGTYKVVPTKGEAETLKIESASMDGWLLFDVAAGNLTRTAIDVTFKMTMRADGQTASMDIQTKLRGNIREK